MVSVIIPNYNHAKYLEKRIQSVIRQTYPHFEVIILDDASTDNSIEIINNYRHHPKVSHVLINEQNTGSTFLQWKKGIALAKGTHIWIAESDDWADKDFLFDAMQKCTADSSINLFFCQSMIVDEKDQVLKSNLDWYDDFKSVNWQVDQVFDGKSFNSCYMLFKNVIPNASAVVFRRFEAEKYISRILDFRLCGDWLFWSLICNDGKVYYSSSPMNYFRNSSQSTRVHSTVEKFRRRKEEEIWFLNAISALVLQKSLVSKRISLTLSKLMNSFTAREFLDLRFHQNVRKKVGVSSSTFHSAMAFFIYKRIETVILKPVLSIKRFLTRLPGRLFQR